jgi:plastocyanin
MRRLLLPALALALLVGIGTAQAAGKTHAVRIEGMKFVPERLDVAAGDTIVWTNQDIVPHTVTAAGAGIESGDLGQGKRWKYVARRKGEIKYLCRLHPGMQGLIAVK